MILTISLFCLEPISACPSSRETQNAYSSLEGSIYSCLYALPLPSALLCSKRIQPFLPQDLVSVYVLHPKCCFFFFFQNVHTVSFLKSGPSSNVTTSKWFPNIVALKITISLFQKEISLFMALPLISIFFLALITIWHLPAFMFAWYWQWRKWPC